jgi:hypothetical protein
VVVVVVVLVCVCLFVAVFSKMGWCEYSWVKTFLAFVPADDALGKVKDLSETMSALLANCKAVRIQEKKCVVLFWGVHGVCFFLVKNGGGLEVLMVYFRDMDDEGIDRQDAHLCVMCLRALMNNAFGFPCVMAHPTAISQICLCLAPAATAAATAANAAHTAVEHTSTLIRECGSVVYLFLFIIFFVCVQPRFSQNARCGRTFLCLSCLAPCVWCPTGMRVFWQPSLILKKFAALFCFLSVVLTTKFGLQVTNERARFQTLIGIVRNEQHHVALIVAAMTFINVVVHCVSDMNFQVCAISFLNPKN